MFSFSSSSVMSVKMPHIDCPCCDFNMYVK